MEAKEDLSKGEGPDWMQLSQELMQEVCGHLPQRDWACMRLCCQSWRSSIAQLVTHVSINLPEACNPPRHPDPIRKRHHPDDTHEDAPASSYMHEREQNAADGVPMIGLGMCGHSSDVLMPSAHMAAATAAPHRSTNSKRNATPSQLPLDTATTATASLDQAFRDGQHAVDATRKRSSEQPPAKRLRIVELLSQQEMPQGTEVTAPHANAPTSEPASLPEQDPASAATAAASDPVLHTHSSAEAQQPQAAAAKVADAAHPTTGKQSAVAAEAAAKLTVTISPCPPPKTQRALALPHVSPPPPAPLGLTRAQYAPPVKAAVPATAAAPMPGLTAALAEQHAGPAANHHPIAHVSAQYSVSSKAAQPESLHPHVTRNTCPAMPGSDAGAGRRALLAHKLQLLPAAVGSAPAESGVAHCDDHRSKAPRTSSRKAAAGQGGGEVVCGGRAPGGPSRASPGTAGDSGSGDGLHMQSSVASSAARRIPCFETTSRCMAAFPAAYRVSLHFDEAAVPAVLLAVGAAASHLRSSPGSGQSTDRGAHSLLEHGSTGAAAGSAGLSDDEARPGSLHAAGAMMAGHATEAQLWAALQCVVRPQLTSLRLTGLVPFHLLLSEGPLAGSVSREIAVHHRNQVSTTNKPFLLEPPVNACASVQPLEVNPDTAMADADAGVNATQQHALLCIKAPASGSLPASLPMASGAKLEPDAAIISGPVSPPFDSNGGSGHSRVPVKANIPADNLTGSGSGSGCDTPPGKHAHQQGSNGSGDAHGQQSEVGSGRHGSSHVLAGRHHRGGAGAAHAHVCEQQQQQHQQHQCRDGQRRSSRSPHSSDDQDNSMQMADAARNRMGPPASPLLTPGSGCGTSNGSIRGSVIPPGRCHAQSVRHQHSGSAGSKDGSGGSGSGDGSRGGSGVDSGGGAKSSRDDPAGGSAGIQGSASKNHHLCPGLASCTHGPPPLPQQQEGEEREPCVQQPGAQAGHCLIAAVQASVDIAAAMAAVAGGPGPVRNSQAGTATAVASKRYSQQLGASLANLASHHAALVTDVVCSGHPEGLDSKPAAEGGKSGFPARSLMPFDQDAGHCAGQASKPEGHRVAYSLSCPHDKQQKQLEQQDKPLPLYQQEKQQHQVQQQQADEPFVRDSNALAASQAMVQLEEEGLGGMNSVAVLTPVQLRESILQYLSVTLHPLALAVAATALLSGQQQQELQQRVPSVQAAGEYSRDHASRVDSPLQSGAPSQLAAPQLMLGAKASAQQLFPTSLVPLLSQAILPRTLCSTALGADQAADVIHGSVMPQAGEDAGPQPAATGTATLQGDADTAAAPAGAMHCLGTTSGADFARAHADASSAISILQRQLQNAIMQLQVMQQQQTCSHISAQLAHPNAGRAYYQEQLHGRRKPCAFHSQRSLLASAASGSGPVALSHAPITRPPLILAMQNLTELTFASHCGLPLPQQLVSIIKLPKLLKLEMVLGPAPLSADPWVTSAGRRAAAHAGTGGVVLALPGPGHAAGLGSGGSRDRGGFGMGYFKPQSGKGAATAAIGNAKHHSGNAPRLLHSCSCLTDAHLVVVAQCAGLTSLRLSQLQYCSGPGVMALVALSGLRSLALLDGLSTNFVWPQHLQALASSLPQLTSLEVGRLTHPPGSTPTIPPTAPSHPPLNNQLLQAGEGLTHGSRQPQTGLATCQPGSDVVCVQGKRGVSSRSFSGGKGMHALPHPAAVVATGSGGMMAPCFKTQAAGPALRISNSGGVLSPLTNLQHLHLQLNGCVEEQLLAAVPLLPCLEHLTLDLMDLPGNALVPALQVLAAAPPGLTLGRVRVAASILYDDQLHALAALHGLKSLALEQVDIRTASEHGWMALSGAAELSEFTFVEWNCPALSTGNMAVLTEESLAMMARCWPLLEALNYDGQVALGDRDSAQALLGAMPSLLHAHIRGRDGTILTAAARPGGGVTCTMRSPHNNLSSRNGYVTFSDSYRSELSESSINFCGPMGPHGPGSGDDMCADGDDMCMEGVDGAEEKKPCMERVRTHGYGYGVEIAIKQVGLQVGEMVVCAAAGQNGDAEQQQQKKRTDNA